MKKNLFRVLAASALLSSAMTLTTFAGVWKQDNIGWWWVNDNGSYPVNTWQWIDGNNDGVAECYYFDGVGYCLLNTTTPDGYQVDANGAWITGGVVQTKVTTVPAANGNGVDIYSLEPDPIKVAQIEELESQGKYYGTYEQKYWYVRLDIDYDTYDMSDSHTTEEKLALNGYLWTLEHEKAMTYLGVHQNYKQYMRDAALFDQGYEAWSLSDDQVKEMQRIEQNFVNNYITDDMSDFEKEMEIVKYLCDNVEYDYETCEKIRNGSQENLIGATGYGALVNGLAVCDGYSNAFYRLCSVCGIEANIVSGTVDTGEGHEWNMVKLDDGWYWVDVTWADAGSGSSIDTDYVNATTTILKKHTAMRVDTGDNIKKATGKKYGIETVEDFMTEKGWKTALQTSNSLLDYEKKMTEYWNKEYAIFDDDSYQTFYYSSVNQTVNDIIAYMSDLIDSRAETFAFKIFYPDSMDSTKIFQSNGSNTGIATQISDKVAAGLDAKYKGTVYKYSAKAILSQDRVYQSRNGYWMTHSRDSRLTRLHYN